MDADGIKDSLEATPADKFIGNYPGIITKIEAPIHMEVEVDVTSTEKGYEEEISQDDLEDTNLRHMENQHYVSLNKKTTPYVTKESYEDSASNSSSYGYENEDAFSHSVSNSNEMAVSVFCFS